MSVKFSNFFAITKANLDKETNRKQYRRDIVIRLGMFIVKYKCRKLQTKNVGRCNYIL